MTIQLIIAGGLGSIVTILFAMAVHQLSKKSAAPVGSWAGVSSPEARRQSELLLNSIPDAVVVTDDTQHVNFFNLAAQRLTGWEQTDAYGIDPKLIFSFVDDKGVPIPQAEHPFEQVYLKGQSIRQTLRLINKTQISSYVSIIISPLAGTSQGTIAGSVAVIRDVSAEQSEEKQRAEFISTASHEMRTPVAAIEGYLALALNEKVSKIDSKARSYLEKAHSSTQHLGKLFQDLLTSAKAEDGRLSNHPVVVELGVFLEQLSEDLRFAVKKKGLSMEFIINKPPNAFIDASQPGVQGKIVRPLYYSRVDPDRIREVVTNLVDNAVKYTDSGKVSIAVTGDDNVVQIGVSDTGAGIAAADIPHLFQKFYRADSSITRTIGGTGLGLFICSKIIELYGGRIWVESILGQGSTFFINLPRLDSQRAMQLMPDKAQISPTNFT